MAITLTEAVEIGYRSIAVGTACAKTLRALCNEPRNEARNAEAANPDSPQGRESRAFRNAFVNLATCNSFAIEFYETGTLYPEGSVKDRLEKLWVTDLGNNLADLPDWDYFSGLSIAQPLTFTQVPVASLDSAQNDFVDNSADIFAGANTLRRQIKAGLDSLISDLWRAEGMRRWLDAEATLTGEPQAAQDEWAFIQNGTELFWLDATDRCLARVDDLIGKADDPNFGKTGHQDSRDKYQWIDTGPQGQRNDLVAAGGLYALDQSQLFGPWNSRLENIQRPSAR